MKEKIKIQYVPIEDLKPAEYNPRKATDKEVMNLTESLRRFGFVDPIIVNSAPERMNVIIGGHFRWRIAKDIGHREAPVVFLNIPDIAKERELNLRLNRNTGDWDWELLANIDKEILVDVGFSSHEIDKVFDLIEDELGSKKELATIDENTAITKKGDIYVMGNHLLLCGDATDTNAVKLLMGDDRARLIFTDPPYNVDYKASEAKYVSGKGIKGDDRTDEEYFIFLTKVLNNYHLFSTNDVTIYWWLADRKEEVNRNAMKAADWTISQTLIWLKERPVFSLGVDYHRVHEPCFLGWKKGHKHYSNRELCNLQTVFHLDKSEFAEILDVWYVERESMADYIHPTQKPVRLAERALKKNTEQGNIVADFFGGSGSTLVACEMSNRKCRMIEYDERYCDKIVARWENLTGRKVKKV